MQIALGKIENNPHRNMKRNPVTKAQVKVLLDSYERNGVWPNVVVRPHPTRKGVYQLAYGHNRLEAMKQHGIRRSEFIVEDITDWGMYTAMVDENESQRTLTPELIYENVESGIEYLEPIVRECETVEEFQATVEISTLGRKEEYSKVRENLLNGQGLGVGFLSKVLPGNKSTDRHNIQAVVDAHYGSMKVAAKKAKAKAKAKDAAAKRKAADAAKDAADAAKLRADAAKLDKEIKELEEAAKKLSSSANQDALLMFKNAAQMTAFAAAVKQHKIPRENHVKIAEHLISAGIGSQNYRREVNVVWFKLSGKADKVRKDHARDTFKRKYADVTLDDFAKKLPPAMRELIKQVDAVTPFAQQIGNAKLKGSIVKACRDAEHALATLREALDSPMDEVTIEEAQKLLGAA